MEGWQYCVCYLFIQWAAVMTHFLAIRVPPQKWWNFSSEKNWRDTWSRTHKILSSRQSQMGIEDHFSYQFFSVSQYLYEDNTLQLDPNKC